MRFKEKEMKSAVKQALNTGFQIDTSKDAAMFNGQTYNWNDLLQLKEELGTSVVGFVGQVNAIVLNPEIISRLGEKKEHFERVVQVFFADIDNFSKKVKELRTQHEHMSGPVTDLTQFNVYNRVAIHYHALFTELQTLITPTLSDIMLTVSEIILPGVSGTETLIGSEQTH